MKKTKKKPAKKPVRRKKLKSTTKRVPSILEYAGYEIGQEVWVRTDPYGSEEWAFGAILEFHPKDSVEPSFSLFDKIRKRYATGAISKIAESPPKRWMGKMK